VIRRRHARVGRKALHSRSNRPTAARSSSPTTAAGSSFLYFYPRDNTRVARSKLRVFRDAVRPLTKLGGNRPRVSKDSIASHCKFRDKYKLSFPLLSDADGKVLEAYGAWGDKTMYGRDEGIIAPR